MINAIFSKCLIFIIIIFFNILGNDKFKVVFFDTEGHVTMQEESQQRKRKSEANMYVVPFPHYNLSESMPLSMMKRLDEEVPPVKVPKIDADDFDLVDSYQEVELLS